MSETFWHERWAQGQIGFHEGAANRFLLRYGERLGPAGAVFVPLCGKSVDLDALRARGWDVTGSELVSLALEQYFSERGERPERAERPFGTAWSLPRRDDVGAITLVQGDVLRFEREGAPFDAVFDRAALVAMDLEDRGRYAAKLTSLLGPGGKMLLVTFEHDMGAGPPHSVSLDEVQRLYGQDFALEDLACEDVLEQNPRFAERGATYVRERALLLTRR